MILELIQWRENVCVLKIWVKQMSSPNSVKWEAVTTI